MTRESLAILVGGLIALILRLGDVLLKWTARRLGIPEDSEQEEEEEEPVKKVRKKDGRMATLAENKYQAKLIKKLYEMFPGCFVLKNDPQYLQGVPDLIVLYRSNWAMLEVKASKGSPSEQNQEYYVDAFGRMSFASFISPETEEAVLYELQRAFGISR